MSKLKWKPKTGMNRVVSSNGYYEILIPWTGSEHNHIAYYLGIYGDSPRSLNYVEVPGVKTMNQAKQVCEVHWESMIRLTQELLAP